MEGDLCKDSVSLNRLRVMAIPGSKEPRRQIVVALSSPLTSDEGVNVICESGVLITVWDVSLVIVGDVGMIWFY